MDHFSLEDLKRSIEKLLDIVRCAVCLETVQGEIVQCVNSHLLCGKCKTGLSDCPTCRQQFSEVRPCKNIIQVIETLPAQCKHKRCQMYLRPNGDDHEKYCGFRIIDCKWCEWEGCAVDLLKHVKEQHPDDRIFTAETETVCLPGFDISKNTHWFTPFYVHDQFFWEETFCDVISKLFVKTLHSVPINKPKDTFFWKIVLNSTQTEFVSKIKLNLDPDVDLDDDEKSIYVPWKTVPNYINKKGNFTYNTHITKMCSKSLT
uniref:RING-type domain-containing protein n=2 Tax=Cuerna arida TaxID=1464854 RepID=A0A1B6F7Y8_9HEMI